MNASTFRRFPPIGTSLVLLLLTAALLLPSVTACGRDEQPRILVYAAASLKDVLTELGREYEADNSVHVAFNWGGSVALANQLKRHAPGDVFISAGDGPMDDLEGGSRGPRLPYHPGLQQPRAGRLKRLPTPLPNPWSKPCGRQASSALQTRSSLRRASTPANPWRAWDSGTKFTKIWSRGPTCGRPWPTSSPAPPRSASSTAPTPSTAKASESPTICRRSPIPPSSTLRHC